MKQNDLNTGQQLSAVQRSKNTAVFLGVSLVLTGLSLNKWSIEQLFVLDAYISSVRFIVAIVIFQICCIVPGLWFLCRRPILSISVALYRITVFGLAVGMLVGVYGNLIALSMINPHREMLETFRTLNASEELILSLTPRLKGLGKSVMNLEFPDHQSHELFDDRVTFVDLAHHRLLPSYKEFFPAVSVGTREWQSSGEVHAASLQELQMWRPYLDGVEYFERAEFKIQEGHFLSEIHDNYETVMLFDGVARMRSGQLISIKAIQTVRWKKRPERGEDEASFWHIYDWRTTTFKTTEIDQPLFVDVLDSAIVDPSDLARARDSIHERLVVQYLRDPENFKKPHKYFNIPAYARNPGISVADLDRDGFDDVYVMARWGENMLFRNRGDGTFEEIAADLGLNIKDHTSSAILADFDNDGDADVFVGRTLARSVYLMNEKGRFVDRSDSLIDAPLPYLVASVSAVDYNEDGLLDIYLSTYQSSDISLTEFLPEADAKQLRRLTKLADSHKFLNRPGPPNVMLRNVGGGRFKTAKESPELRVFRQTFQASWSDFDGDGDPDVYLANDFAPNNLLRNDGNGKFVDVTEQTGTADIGFGMGVTWGDYDNDGKQDLYVTNMYSKAGRRITEQIARLDPRFSKMARGNSLFRQASGRFDKVSGLAPPDLMVEKGGWGWGSQFVDVDNDGYLDIYALSGYYTAPKEVARPVDR